jgi:hypothetical protein
MIGEPSPQYRSKLPKQYRSLENEDTVKASNFEPHGNLGPLFSEGFFIKGVLQQYERNNSCRKTFDLRILFVHSLDRIVPKKQRILQK